MRNFRSHSYRLIFMAAFVFIIMDLSGQSINLSFTGKHNGVFVPFDSVVIENLTQGSITKLTYPDTTLLIGGTVNIQNQAAINKKLTVSSNFPNPFTDHTFINMYLPNREPVFLKVYDITGREISHYQNILNEGYHQFIFNPGSDNFYFLSVRTQNEEQTIKMFHVGNSANRKSKINYNGELLTSSLDDSKSENLKSVNTGFPFSIGDSLCYTGYTTHGLLYIDTIIDKPVESKTITFTTEWRHFNNLLDGMNKVYDMFYLDGVYLRMFPWVMDIRADDVWSTSPWWTYEVAEYKFSAENPCYFIPWDHHFFGIYRANEVLEYAPAIEMNEDLKLRIKGEAYFLRGLFYYNLLNLYREVPVITAIPVTYNDIYPTKTSRDEAWAQVIMDFISAMEILPMKHEYETEDQWRATKGAAAGFLGKSYMITGKWTEAENILKTIIDWDVYALVDNYRDNFTVANENNSESLFEVQFGEDLGGNVRYWFASDYYYDYPDLDKTSAKAKIYAPVPYGWGDITPSDWIYEQFLLDTTIYGNEDPRLSSSMWYEGNDTMIYGDPTKSIDDLYIIRNPARDYKVFNRKYLNDETLSSETEWHSEINERILRYADILLLYAETLNELDRTDEAYPFIQMVRDRADLSDLSEIKPEMSQDEMRDQIAHERLLEFCFEGQRYIDLLRWGWFSDEEKLEELKERDSNYNFFKPGREFFPIPQTALDANPNIEQDEAWIEEE